MYMLYVCYKHAIMCVEAKDFGDLKIQAICEWPGQGGCWEGNEVLFESCTHLHHLAISKPPFPSLVLFLLDKSVRHAGIIHLASGV